MLTEIIALLIGWGLGLFSPIIVDWVKGFSERKNFKDGLRYELGEIKGRLVAYFYEVSVRYGPYNRDTLTWVKNNSEGLILLTSKEEMDKELEKELEKGLKLTDEELQKIQQLTLEDDKGKSLVTGKINPIYLEANLDKISLLKPNVQQNIFLLKSRINLFNEGVSENRYYFELTFDASLTAENTKINEDNLHGVIVHQKDSAKIIIEIIKEILDSLESK